MAFPIAARFAHPDNGYKGDQDQAARHLTVGKVYVVTGIEVGRSSSRLFLAIPDAPTFGFNTVMFEPASVDDDDGAIAPDDDPEPDDDDDWDDRDDYREPDPEDADIARAYEEHAEHCEQVHGGGECDCGPSLAVRAWQLARDIGDWLADPWVRLRIATWHPWTLRIGPVEVTLRLRAGRRCGGCGGRGWGYSLLPGREDDRPPGYNGVSLCPCGSATTALAESRRYLRERRDEPPF